MHTETSNFPSEIDERIFFSELSLNHTDIQKEYNSLIRRKKYKEASKLIFDRAEIEDNKIDYYGKYSFNMIEDRLKTIGQYLIDMPQEKDQLFVYSNLEPTGVEVNTVWIA